MEYVFETAHNYAARRDVFVRGLGGTRITATQMKATKHMWIGMMRIDFWLQALDMIDKEGADIPVIETMADTRIRNTASLDWVKTAKASFPQHTNLIEQYEYWATLRLTHGRAGRSCAARGDASQASYHAVQEYAVNQVALGIKEIIRCMLEHPGDVNVKGMSVTIDTVPPDKMEELRKSHKAAAEARRRGEKAASEATILGRGASHVDVSVRDMIG